MVPELDPILETSAQTGVVMLTEDLQELTGITPRPPLRDRMTVVDKVYHQPQNGEAYCCETTFERQLDDKESVYSRKTKVGIEWKRLHLGWFTDDGKSVGMLVIRNDEGRHLQTIPSDEEKQKIAGLTLEIGVLTDPKNFRSAAIKAIDLLQVHPAVYEPTVCKIVEFIKSSQPQSTTLFWVLPGESMRATPSGVDLYVRCLGGECSFTVFAFPK